MFKKIIALVLTLVLAAACLTACGGANGTTLKDVQKAGKLTVATSPDFPPFESLEGGEVVGIEIDILKLICAELGVELEVVQMDFDSVLIGIQAGTVLEDLPLSDFKVYSDLFEEDLYQEIDLLTCVEKRISRGGTSVASVEQQIAYVKERI